MSVVDQQQPQIRFRISTAIYIVIYVVSLIVTFLTISLNANAFRLSGWYTWLLAVTSAGLLSLIYYDMHRIDDLKFGAHDYPGWATEGRWSELILRCVIVFALLVGVGEFTHSLRDAVALVSTSTGASDKDTLAFLDNKTFWFVHGSFVAFVAIIVWNTYAVILRFHGYKSRRDNASCRRELAKDWLTSLRILLFIALSIFCAIYWGMVWMYPEQVGAYVEFFVIMYSILFGVVFALLIPPSRAWFEGWLTRAVESMSGIPPAGKQEPAVGASAKKDTDAAQAGRSALEHPLTGEPPLTDEPHGG